MAKAFDLSSPHTGHPHKQTTLASTCCLVRSARRPSTILLFGLQRPEAGRKWEGRAVQRLRLWYHFVTAQRCRVHAGNYVARDTGVLERQYPHVQGNVLHHPGVRFVTEEVLQSCPFT